MSSAIQSFVLYVNIDNSFIVLEESHWNFDGAARNPHNAIVIAALMIFLQIVNSLHSSVFHFSLVFFRYVSNGPSASWSGLFPGIIEILWIVLLLHNSFSCSQLLGDRSSAEFCESRLSRQSWVLVGGLSPGQQQKHQEPVIRRNCEASPSGTNSSQTLSGGECVRFVCHVWSISMLCDLAGWGDKWKLT